MMTKGTLLTMEKLVEHSVSKTKHILPLHT